MLPYQRFLQEVLIDEQSLQRRVAELGAQITQDYAGIDELVLICILKGGVMFTVDLSRHITVPHEIDFLAASSYGKGKHESSGTVDVRIEKDLTAKVNGRHLLIVEDIIDSGLTLSVVMDMLKAKKPASLKLCTLLDKPEGRAANVSIQVDYIGFTIPKKFVFGYGLDLNEKFRNLPFIGVVNLEALRDSQAAST
jgi:hypoxanthine phosphoribosyltransferase